MGIFKNFLGKLDETEESDIKTLSDVTVQKVSEVMTQVVREQNIQKKLIDNVFLFMGTSGGTGCSTIVSNIATVLGKKNLKVLVIDSNILMPSLPYMMNLEQGYSDNDLYTLTTGTKEFRECIKTQDSVSPLAKNNISLLYANDRRLNDYLNIESTNSKHNIEAFIEDAKQVYDIIIIDCPSRVDNLICNTFMYLADTIYFVWDESVGSVVNTNSILEDMLISGIAGQGKSRVILNKRTNVKYSNIPFKKLGLRRVETLPFCQEIIQIGLEQKMFIESASSNSANTNDFVNGIHNICKDMLERGGFIDNGQ